MSRLIKINGQLVRFEELVNRANDYKEKRWRYTKSGDVEEVTNETELDDDIVFSGSKSNLRRIADLERNVSVLATKIVTASDTAGFEEGVDNNFGNLFDEDVRIKGDLFRISSDLVYIDPGVTLDLNGNKLTQVGTPTLTDDAATKGYVDTAVANLVDSAPTTLDTLNELAAALGDDADFATTVTNSLANKADTSAIPTDVADLTDNTSLLGGGFSGSYNDLTDTPTIPADVSDLTDTTNLLTHFSGSYDDLTDVPFIIESSVNSIFFDASTPNGMLVGDLWFNASNNKLYKAIANPNNATVDNTMVNSPADIIFPAPGGTSVNLANGSSGDRTVTFVTPITIAGFYGIENRIDLKSVTFEDDTVVSGVDLGGSVWYRYGVEPLSSQVVGGIFNQGKKVKSLLFARGRDPNNNYFNLIAAGAPIWEEVDSGYTTLASITSSDLDMGTNKILYSNVYSAIEDLPSASSYHGMFAHVHGTGKAYYAHAGSWVELANVSELPSLTGYATETFVNTAISNLVNGADAAFDTLKEIADAMATDTELSTAISNLTIPSVLTDLSITDGTAGQVLTTDGAGGFTFADAAGGGASVEVSGTAPSSPETGDLWFDSDNTGELYVYNGSAWITTADGGGGSSSGGGASIELSDTAPSSPTAGALWFKTDTLNLYVYYSSNWVEIGDGGSGGTSGGGGASVTVDATAPTDPSEGDLWYNSTYGDLLIYLGNAWVVAGGTTAAESPWTSATSTTTLYTGQKVLADTSSSAVTLTLPSSPSLGDEVRIIDAAGNAATNNITVARNGSNIMGLAEDFVININEAAFGLVYFNATRGWVLTEK